MVKDRCAAATPCQAPRIPWGWSLSVAAAAGLRAQCGLQAPRCAAAWQLASMQQTPPTGGLSAVAPADSCSAGGLGDVMGALPKALVRRGHRTMVVAPRYSDYAEGWETGVRVSMRVMSADVEVGYFHGYIDGVDYVFVDHPCYHGRQDNIYGGDRSEVRSVLQCADWR